MCGESAQAVYLISGPRNELNIDEDFHENTIHIHIPKAIPKDGPSAVITMATALVSAN